MRKKVNELDEIINEQLKNSKFAEAWTQTELEYQVKISLIKARIESGLTQKELSERSGIRQSNISRIENGTAIPTIQTLFALAKGSGKKLKIIIE